MDSVDDFEFKPLTEGLGFNKKPEKHSAGGHGAGTSGSATKRDENRAESRSVRASRFEEELGAKAAPKSALDSDFENELLGRDSAQRPSANISELIASLPPSLDFVGGKEERNQMPSIEPNLNVPEGGRPQIFQPFAREDFKAGITKSPIQVPTTAAIAAPTVGSALKGAALSNPLSAKLPIPGSKAFTPPASAVSAGSAAKVPSAYRDRLNESFSRAFPHVGRKGDAAKETAAGRGQAKETARETAKRRAMATEISGLQPVAASLGSGVIDAMVVTGMSSILLVAIVAITRVNLYRLLTNVRTDGPTQIHMALLFLACLQLYLLTARSFFGASLGEWAFDLQLGSADDQARPYYPLQVAWRTILVTLTGLVMLPLFSLIFRRDLSKYATGLQLYLRKV